MQARVWGTSVALVISLVGGIWAGIVYMDSRTSSISPVIPTPAPSSPDSTPTTPTPIGGPYTGEALAFGDFLFLSVGTCLQDNDFVVDAQGDRRIENAAAELAELGDEVPGAVLLHLGANGGASQSDIDRIMDVLGPDRIVVWSTIQLPDDGRYTFEADTNALITGLPVRYPNVRILSWNALSLTDPTWINADGSITNEGCEAFARFAESVVRGPVA